jgi:O-antigen ligase
VGPLALALLIWAGSLKETPLFDWVPVDLTLAAAVVVAAAVIDSRLRGGGATKAVAAPLLFFTMLLPAALINQSPTAYSISKIAVLFTISLLLAVAPFYLLRANRQRTVFLLALVAFGVLSAANLIFAPTEVANSPGRFIVEGSNTIAVSRIVLAAAVILLIAATVRGLRLTRRFVMALGAVVLTAVATLTGSRGPLIALLLAIGVTVVTATVYRRYRVRAVLGIVGVVLIGGWYLLQSSQSEGLARIVGTLTGESGTAPDARVLIWSYALELFTGQPLGRGWGAFTFMGMQYPHNLFLEIAVEAGVLVLAVVLVLLVATLLRGAHVAVDWQTSAILGLFVFAFANAMVSSDINGNRLLLVAGFAIWAIPKKPKTIYEAAGKAEQTTTRRSDGFVLGATGAIR